MQQVLNFTTIALSLVVSSMALLSAYIDCHSKNHKVVSFFTNKKYYIVTSTLGVIGILFGFAAIFTSFIK